MAGEKRKASEDSGNSSSGKKRQAITMKTKVAIIKRHDAGEKMVNVTRSYKMNCSFRTIYNKDDAVNRN